MGAITLLALMLLVFSAAGCVPARPESTWAELEAVAETYPVDPTLMVTEIERRGELCRNPGCESPRVILHLAPRVPQTPEELCNTVVDGLRAWDGFEFAETQSEDATQCSLTGEIDGRTGNIFVLTKEETAGGQVRAVVNVSV